MKKGNMEALWEQYKEYPAPSFVEKCASEIFDRLKMPYVPEAALLRAVFGEQTYMWNHLPCVAYVVSNTPEGTWKEYLDKAVEELHQWVLSRVESTRDLMKPMVEEALASVPERWQTVITLRYGLDSGKPRTLNDVGAELGRSCERVRQIESRALRTFRHPSISRVLKPGLELMDSTRLALLYLEEHKPLRCEAKSTWYFEDAHDRLELLLDCIRGLEKKVTKLRSENLELARTNRELREWVADFRVITGTTRANTREERRSLFKDAGLSTRTTNALARRGIPDIAVLSKLTQEQLLDVRNLGPKALDEINRVLDEWRKEGGGE